MPKGKLLSSNPGVFHTAKIQRHIKRILEYEHAASLAAQDHE
jgi:hypothetical protein